MTLVIRMAMGVKGKESERAEVERLRAKIAETGRVYANITLDASLANDFCEILGQLGTLARRARARAANRRKAE